MNPVAEPAAADTALRRAKPWLEKIPLADRTQDWKEAKALLDMALDGRGSDIVIDILYTCAAMPCPKFHLLRCDRPETLREPKEWCAPCRARKLLGIIPK